MTASRETLGGAELARRWWQRARRRGLWVNIFGLGLAAVLFFSLYSSLDPQRTWAHLQQVGPGVLLVLLPWGIAQIVDTVAWRRMFQNLGRRIHLLHLLPVRYASDAVLISVSGGPILAEGVGPFLLRRKHQVPLPESVATLGLRKTLLILAQAFYVGLGAVVGFAFLSRASEELLRGPFLPYLLLGVAFVLFIVSVFLTSALMHGAVGGRLLGVLARFPNRRFRAWVLKTRQSFLETDEYLRRASGGRLREIARLAGLFFLGWLGEALETYLILQLLGADLTFHEVWAFEPALSLLRHLVFFVPAGLGVQDVGYVAFLRAAGMDDALALGTAFVVIKRTKELVWVGIGLAFLYGQSRRVAPPGGTGAGDNAEDTVKTDTLPPRGEDQDGQKKVLMVCGSMNQTRQMVDIAEHLVNCDVWFTPYFVSGISDLGRRLGLLEMSIAGNEMVRECQGFLRRRGLQIDYRGHRYDWDLVVTCCDQNTQTHLKRKPMVLVQEGMTDPLNFLWEVHKVLPIVPRWMMGTGAMGQSRFWQRFCVASEGYRDYFAAHGLDSDRIVVTGIPNFDNCRKYLKNNFPHRDYVLVCTSDARETFKFDNRRKFIDEAIAIAKGRPIIFKLHPNENVSRATREIQRWCPGAQIYARGSAEEMVANCEVLICQYSSLAFIGIALQKEVHSYFDVEELKKLCPIQRPQSAVRIAEVCHELLYGVPVVALESGKTPAVEVEPPIEEKAS